MIKKFRVYAREVETKDGKKYITCSYTKEGERFYDVKFTRTCEKVVKFPGYFLIEADTKDISKEKGKRYEVNGNSFIHNDIIWIKNAISVERDTAYEEELYLKREREIEELFE